jgi:predicted RNA-binding Zn ribbon-like protein
MGVRARVTSADLRAARALREAIWSCAQAAIGGAELPARARGVILRAAERPDLVPTLREGVMTWAGNATGAQALSRVARDAIALFGTPAVERLHRCENPNCYLLFVDTSRPGRRRWCTMRRCGNLAKLARYRGRPAKRRNGEPALARTV